jgi:hypothetical protein
MIGQFIYLQNSTFLVKDNDFVVQGAGGSGINAVGGDFFDHC